ncbi:MAG TPA: RagB/SusD family nutrient uptake outer membrane protein [Gemmatimonadales bacterium]|nr:RagB/SusD family nutrient uptake outer membrane protein [Gemmatimonadales bacterium]
MTTQLTIRSVHAGALRVLLMASVTAGLFFTAGCSDFFNVTDKNQPVLDSLLANPTRQRVMGAAIGIFGASRVGMQSYIWRLGSMGREGINLSGNNQPDYQEPFYGPLQGTGFGGSQWADRYAAILDINIYLQALGLSKDFSDPEKAASRGMANTMKALNFLYVILTRDSLGAPVDVYHPLGSPPAPFLAKDSVYGAIIGLLDSAQADLNRAIAGSSGFPFSPPPGFNGFDTPATFIQFNRALAAKAQVMRATAGGCRGTPDNCWRAALTALGGSFLSTSPAEFQKGVYFDFSSAANDITNDLSEPLNGNTFFSLDSNVVDADTQPTGAKDQRVLDKIAVSQDTQRLGGIPIVGTAKFTLYFTVGKPDPAHEIPIVRDEELVLLDAEAQWFATTGSKTTALSDLNAVRGNAGKLAPTTLTVLSPDTAFVTELLYNRRYSLLWEQGTRWLDARRYGRLATLPIYVFGGNVPKVMPIPDVDCSALGLASNCTPTLTP